MQPESPEFPSDIAEAYRLKYLASTPPSPPSQMVPLEEELAKDASKASALESCSGQESGENQKVTAENTLSPTSKVLQKRSRSDFVYNINQNQMETVPDGVGRIECSLCNIWTAGAIPMRAHKLGSKHRNAMHRKNAALSLEELYKLDHNWE